MQYCAYVHRLDSVLDQFKALSEETRFRLFRVLAESGEFLCVCELTDILQIPQYAASRGLNVLKRAGLVEELREGKMKFYRVTGEPGAETESEEDFVSERSSDIKGLIHSVLSVPASRPVSSSETILAIDSDRLRWRIDIRQQGKCVITYRGDKTHKVYPQGEEESMKNDEDKQKVLFICVHNSARSQMAEEYCRQFAGDRYEVESAGLEPGELNPYVVKVLKEDGIDIIGKKTQSVLDLYRQGKTYSYVITVCSREAEEKCPIFPGPVRRIHWPFTDPSKFEGTEEKITNKTREIRDSIKNHVKQFAEANKTEYIKENGNE